MDFNLIMMDSHPIGSDLPNLLITGAGGFLGHWLCVLARRHWSVHAQFKTRPPAVQGIQCHQIDLTDDRKLAALVSAVRPRAIIHAAAVARAAQCESAPEATAAINVNVPLLLADLCAEAGIDLLFTSTDLVFDGRRAPYDEGCPPDPVCVYGEQKARAESAVMEHWPRALICRLPLLFGLAPHADDHFGVQMLKSIAAGRSLNLFADEYRTPVDNHDAALGLLTLLGRAQGILHMGGRTRVSRHALGLLMAQQMGIAPGMIRSVSIDSIPTPYQRSPDCSLDSRRAYRLGYDPAPLSEALARTVAQFLASG
jgi:dTDP-4-dehydrorhamnose reductase